jgi:beta-glucosidase
LHSDRIKEGQPLTFQVTLKNLGGVDADEVVQVYLSDLQASAPVPLQKLVGFRRVHVRAGRGRTLRFVLPPEAMQFVDGNGEQKLEAGEFRLTVGDCSPGKRGVELGAPVSLSAIFSVH